MSDCDDLYGRAKQAVLDQSEATFRELEKRLRLALGRLGIKTTFEDFKRNGIGHNSWGYGYREVTYETCGLTLSVNNRDKRLHADAVGYFRRDDGYIGQDKAHWEIKTLVDLERPLRYAKEQQDKKAALEAEDAAKPPASKKKSWWPFK